MVLRLRKLGIQCFKRIAIQSSNERDMGDGSKAMQRACSYRIEFGPNNIWLFGLIFWASFGLNFMAIGSVGFFFFH